VPALIPSNFIGEVVFLGLVENRNAALQSAMRHTVEATFFGFLGESHSGLTRPSCARSLTLYPRETEIRNTRQISIISQEELDIIADSMGLDTLDPTWLGASMVVKGIPDFTLIPPSSRLQFSSGTTLTVDLESRPCILPAPVIEHHRPGFGKLFKPAAKNLRGVTAWVEREGPIAIGDSIILYIPEQPSWPHSTQ